MIEEGQYVYCLINENKRKNFGYIGINNRQVNTVPYRDIAAVVSDTPIIEFDRLNKKGLIGYASVHQKVNQEMMKDYEVVPMTFGVIAPSIEEVKWILGKVYLQFKAALKKIRGRAEFAVQAKWNPKRVLEEMADTDPRIQALKQKADSKRGILGMASKMKLGRLIQRKMETKRQVLIKEISASLNELASDFTQNKLIADEMIANLSLLIEKDKEGELDKKMQELGKKYEKKMRFKYMGPFPPYSFTNINLKLGNFETVDRARKALGLPEIATFDEIKQTYYELSHRYHPDRFGKGEEEMKRIIQAYRVLESYCRSCDGLKERDWSRSVRDPKHRQYSFKKEDVEESLIVK